MYQQPTLTLLLDGEAPSTEGQFETLSDLLAEADVRFAARGRIVTVLRLDGADEPAFRERHVIERRLSTLQSVEIESGTPAALALECLAEAGGALHGLAAAAGDVARRLRAGEIRGGNRDLAAISEGIATVVAITGAASLGLGIDLSTRDTPYGTLAAMAQRAARDLDTIIAGQLAANWNAIADVLDDDLAPHLRAWGETCSAVDLESDPTPTLPVSPLQIQDRHAGG